MTEPPLPDPTLAPTDESPLDPVGGAARRSRRARWLAFLALAPTLAAVLLATLGPLTSGDLWWHLRTGEWILASGELPRTDPFSHTAGDTHWVLQEYGSQVLFALAFRLGGFWALKVLGALLAVATLVCVYLRARADVRASWAALFTAAFALLFALKWELRPHLISVLFFFWLERCLFPRGRALTAKRFTTPPLRRALELFVLSMVWVQLHAEALFAPLFGLAVLAGACVAALRERSGAAHAVRWLVLFLAALLGTLASPLFFEPHVYALVGRGVPQLYIEEWFRPWVLPGDPRFAPVSLGVFAAYVVALAIGLWFALRRALLRLRHEPAGAELARRAGPGRAGLLARQVTWERLAFLAGCLLFALSARRFFWLTWFPLLDAAAWWLQSARGRRSAAVLLPVATLGLGLLTLATHYPAAALRSLDRGRGAEVVDAALFPKHAAELVRDAGLEGNLFHPYEWGGYLGYVTAQPVFIDGRTVLFEEVIPERWIAENDPGRRAEILDARGVDVIVMDRFVETPAGLRPWTPGGGGWLAVWVDGRAAVWVRRGSANEARARAFWDAAGVPFDARHGLTAAAVNLAHPKWLRERDMLPDELVDALRGVEAAAGAGELARAVARARFWQARRLGKNLAVELDHAFALALDADGPLAPATRATLAERSGRLDPDDRAGRLAALEAALASG